MARTQGAGADEFADSPPEASVGTAASFGPAPGRLTSWRRPGRVQIGIEVGTATIKVVQVRITRSGIWLEAGAVLAAPPGSGGDRRPGARGRAIGDVISTARCLLRMRRGTAGAVLSAPAVTAKLLNLPRLPEAQLRQALRFEAPPQLSLPTDSAVFSYAVVPGTETAIGEVGVFVAGTRRDQIEEQLAACRRGGFRLEALELDQLVVPRALQTTGRWRDAATVVVDLGESGCRMSAFRQGTPLLHRTLAPGLGRLRVDLGLGEPPGAAPGMAAVAAAAALPGADKPLPDPVTLGATIGAVLQSPMGRSQAREWLGQVREGIAASLQFFLMQARGVEIADITLVGGGACIPGLVAALAAEPLPMSGQPSPGLRVADFGSAAVATEQGNAGALAPALLVALGSALRGREAS